MVESVTNLIGHTLKILSNAAMQVLGAIITRSHVQCACGSAWAQTVRQEESRSQPENCVVERGVTSHVLHTLPYLSPAHLVRYSFFGHRELSSGYLAQ